MESERGTVTIWMLGLSMLLMVFAGIGLDFWRGLAVQRELASIADAAAVAAASGIDEEHYRMTGEILLEEERARSLALASIDRQGLDLASVDVDVTGIAVTVVVEDAVHLGLLGVLVDESEPLTVSGSATASPRLVP